MIKFILITGGTGYIGSHTVVDLIKNGYSCLILDNFSNSKPKVIDQITQLTNQKPVMIEGDIRDKKLLSFIFKKYPIKAALHFAGLKAVGESEQKPLLYFDNNVAGTCTLLNAMIEHGVHYLVFSSSATVYGNPGSICYAEDLPLNPINTYGRTKMVIELMLNDIAKANPKFKVAVLRYFNPVGAHHSGLLGEDPQGIPNNLMPYIAQVGSGTLPALQVFGGDYPTPDGTGRRDYIHVDDLANGHILALEKIMDSKLSFTVNLGTGRSHSVLELIRCFEAVSGKKIPHTISERRAGDLAEYYANPSLAQKLLGWTARHNLSRMCEDVWRYQSRQLQ